MPLVASLALLAALAPTPDTDELALRRAFQELSELSRRDGGRLWGQEIGGPLLLVDPKSRRVWANEADGEGRLKAKDGVYSGTLPKETMVANTSLDWAGRRWAMVLLPLPDAPQARRALLGHESWHRIQEELGFPAAEKPNAHLDSPEGRLWLRLEWRALKRALEARSTRATREAAAEALAFRARRFRSCPAAAAEEAAMERHEGLAEYTGVHLSGTPAEARAYAARDLQHSEALPTFTRSFAYRTGPAYGLLLDVARSGWARKLRPDDDLGDVLRRAWGLKLPDDAATDGAAAGYGADAVRAEETEREGARRVRLGAARLRYVEGAVLEFPLHGKYQLEMDPRNQMPFEPSGTIYPTLRLVADWGVLDVKGGALLSADWTWVKVPVAATEPKGRAVSGPGWSLELKEGFALTPGSRKGDFTIHGPSDPQK